MDNNKDTNQGIDEQHPGQKAQEDVRHLAHQTEPIDPTHMVAKLRSIADAIEKDPAKLEELRGILAENTEQIDQSVANLKNLLHSHHWGENQLNIDWQEVGFVALCLLIA